MPADGDRRAIARVTCRGRFRRASVQGALLEHVVLEEAVEAYAARVFRPSERIIVLKPKPNAKIVRLPSRSAVALDWLTNGVGS